MTIFYLDYVNGSDAADGSSWANAWKTITAGPTAARIAPGDIIRIAKSPAPSSIGNGTWTDLSKTVTLASAQNATIELCEALWTANGSGDTTVALVGVATDAKEGSNSIRLTLDSSPQTSIMQAYKATGTLNLSSYQKISFWIKNSAAIVANNWTVTLCSDTAGATPVDTFAIPAIPSTARWVPITLARNGGGNLGSSIQSIALNTGSVGPTASSNILIDNFIACTTNGLNLQSLISKNSLEQGGTEPWLGIQSIVTTTVLLDNETNTKGNTGRGYSGTSETVTTYFRETIKTDMVSASTTVVQEVQEGGTLASGDIQFQGGYDTGTSLQTGETFFDGLNGQGYGLQASSRQFVTLNHISVTRYNNGFFITTSNNITVSVISDANNNTSSGLYFNNSYGCNVGAIANVCNNGNSGINMSTAHNHKITTISNANSNSNYGVYMSVANNNKFTTISNANNSVQFGILMSVASSNVVDTINTKDNTAGGIGASSGRNYIGTATIAESTKVGGAVNYGDAQVFIQSISSYSNVWYEYGSAIAQAATAGGSGTEWKMSITSQNRASNYPIKLKLAEIAVGASTQVTVTCYFKKSHATDIAAKLVTPGGELSGVSETTATAPSDTVRNQLQIQFTPSAAGIVSIEAWAWWVANVADENVIIDDIAVTQA